MQQSRLANSFDRRSASWDAVYTGGEGPLHRLWDRLMRRNIGLRFQFVLEVGSPWAGKRVLDVGCGTGRYGLALAQRGASEIVGVDISAEMLAVAKRSAIDHQVADRCRFLRCDASEFVDAQGFDTVIAIGFFDYVPEPLGMLRHIGQFARESLFATFPVLWAFRVPFRWLWWAHQGCRIHLYTQAEIERLFQEAGFVIVSLVRRGPIYLAHTKRAKPCKDRLV